MIINFPLVLLAWASVPSLVTSSNTQSFPLALRSENITAPLIQNATTNKIEQARQVVKDAIAEATKRNKARLDHPARKINKLKPGTQINTKRDDGEKPAPALLEITHEIAAAAALLAELDASTNDTVIMKPRASSFWMENISRKGTHPTSWGGSSGYKIYRNVKDYGAKGDGKTDDTAAINKAIMDGDRCGEGCNGAANKNAIVYFPSGTYLVSSTIKVVFGTQLIGDANSRPEIRAAASFVGLGVLSTDEYVPDGGNGADGKALEWYINTARFYGQIRNFIVDITRTDAGAYVCAIHYQVAQATSMQDVELVAKTGTTQQGMFSENGSGGVMSDVTFRGGNFGFYGGNQQFTAQRLNFIGCKTAVGLIWSWGWVWKSVKISDADVGFRLLSEDGASAIGSITVMDSVFSNVATGILTIPASKDTASGTTGLTIENSAFKSVSKIVADTSGKTYLTGTSIKHWTLGPTYKAGTRTWTDGLSSEYKREESLLAPSSAQGDLPGRPYFERKREQYASTDVSQFVHIKDYGAKGDGSSDDTQAVQKALDGVGSTGKILFVDAGMYMLTDTVTVPKNVKIVGECWAAFVAVGSKFSDVNSPRVMLRVGKDGDVGSVELQDLIVLTKGGTAGAILIEWNIKADKQGSAAMWDVHARIGGALGSDQNPADCPAITSGTNPSKCQVATMMMHITSKASGLLDNAWMWTSDHLIDDPDRKDPKNDMKQLSVYVARGILIESQNPVWLYGTASEHATFYQYSFYKARNVFAGLLQTEPPYYQPMPKAPAPFKDQVGKFPGDPDYSCKGDDFDGCDTAWAVVIKESQNIMIASAGTYSWFDKYSQDCIDEQKCQKALWSLDKNYNNVRIQNLITIGAKYMIVSEGKGVLASENLATKAHPRWSHLSFYDAKSNGDQPTDDTNDVCDPNDATWKAHDAPNGVYFPDPDITGWDWSQSVSLDASTTYVTIINLTPHTFKFDHVDSYQMVTMDFADILPGQSRQNVMTYFGGKDGKNPVDDKGEAYYKIDGTDKEFVIKARTHIPDLTDVHRVVVDIGGLDTGTVEIAARGAQRAVNIIITGSKDYKFYASPFSTPTGWMKEIKDVIGPRKVKHVVMPGTHDSAMSVIGKYAWFGVADNTQTQAYNIYEQALIGARYFDLRIINVQQEDGTMEFHTAHTSIAGAFGVVGATGIRIEEFIRYTNQFTSEHPGEVLIFYISRESLFTKLLGDAEIEHGSDNRDMNAAEFKALHNLLAEVNNRCPMSDSDLSTPIEDHKMGEFLNKNDGKGCVLFVFDKRVAGTAAYDVTRGFFSPDQFSAGRKDVWAEEKTLQPMVRKEVAAISNNRGDSSTDRFHIMQWIITPDPVTPVFQGGIEAISVRYAYDALFWAGAGNMAPKSFPTVMLLDYFGVMIPGRHDLTAGDIYEARTLAIGLNLYMVSENCDTGVIKHPLKNPKTNTKMARGVLVNDTLRVDGDLFKRLEIGPVPLTIAEAKRRKRSAAVGRFARPKP